MISQLSVAVRAQDKLAIRAMSTEGVPRIIALCQANSEVLSRNIAVIDNLIERNHLKKAQEIYTKTCPITGTTLGRQFRHSLDHFEKLALDGLNTVRDDKHEPIDLHYDRRERGGLIEKDICEARKRIVFIQDVFDGVIRESQGDVNILDGKKPLTAYFTLPKSEKVAEDVEFPLASTLEREMGFVCHHAIHHNKIIKAMARAGETGLKVEDLPQDFGLSPKRLLKKVDEEERAA